jgi:2-dehydro-3-deoxyphosphogluconate aldolase / (4S)-4-hydroxy-2-oxoglutarate aldolase
MTMFKLKVLGRVLESGLVAIVRTHSSDQAARIADACALGGAAAIEITFTVPGAAAVIEALSRKYASGEILIGAGTVLDPGTARIAILAGAQYIVSPSVKVETARLCNRVCRKDSTRTRKIVALFVEVKPWLRLSADKSLL